MESIALYEIMKGRTQANFCVYAQLKNHIVICISPERFITKKGNTILSQPIKGTKKSSSNQEENQGFIQQLRDSPKDRGRDGQNSEKQGHRATSWTVEGQDSQIKERTH